MNTGNLKANLKRWTLFLGVLQITVGCLVGFIPPSAVAWFRGIVMAHIEFTANGVLMTRPLCPFPALPRYAGSGDPTDAASFACVDDGVHYNPTPAPEYLKD